MFTFLKLLLLSKCRHNWFLKKLKQCIKETRFYHHTFLFFKCDDLSFIKATQKTLKSSKKMFQFPGWMRKNFKPWNFSWRVSAETWDASCFKNGLMEKQQCSKHFERYIFSDAFFKYLSKYVKLVIPKILCILVLCNFNFYLKIMWSPAAPPSKIIPSSPLHQNKNFRGHERRLSWVWDPTYMIMVPGLRSFLEDLRSRVPPMTWVPGLASQVQPVAFCLRLPVPLLDGFQVSGLTFCQKSRVNMPIKEHKNLIQWNWDQ